MTQHYEPSPDFNCNHLIVDIDAHGVATITLNRPQRHNAFNAEVIAELLSVLTKLKFDLQVKLLILRSNGQHFSAGADLNWMRTIVDHGYQENLDDCAALAQLMAQLYQFPKPTLALVQGTAFGGALGLIACCDIAFANSDAQFCFSEVKIGLIPAVISPYIVAAIGQRQARRYCLTAETFTAAQAMQLGLIHQIGDNLDNLAAPSIQALLNNSPAAKSLIQDIYNRPISTEMIADTSQRIAAIRVSAEGQEGLAAFLDKRAPIWHKE